MSVNVENSKLLTEEEKEILRALAKAWNEFIGEKTLFPPDNHEFASALNAAQNIIFARAIIRESNKETLAYKALSIIEYIASHEQIDREHTWLIYEAAHVALGDCRADHSEWVAKIEGLYNKLKQEKRL